MEQMYESKISVKRWIVYDIFGNLGWLGYFICAGKLLEAGLTASYVLVPAAVMLVGLVELISERIAKLDYVLPKSRLYRGFGALTLGGICGTVYAAGSLWVYRARGMQPLLWGLVCGGVLCAVFAGLLFREYRPMEK